MRSSQNSKRDPTYPLYIAGASVVPQPRSNVGQVPARPSGSGISVSRTPDAPSPPTPPPAHTHLSTPSAPTHPIHGTVSPENLQIVSCWYSLELYLARCLLGDLRGSRSVLLTPCHVMEILHASVPFLQAERMDTGRLDMELLKTAAALMQLGWSREVCHAVLPPVFARLEQVRCLSDDLSATLQHNPVSYRAACAHGTCVGRESHSLVGELLVGELLTQEPHWPSLCEHMLEGLPVDPRPRHVLRMMAKGSLKQPQTSIQMSHGRLFKLLSSIRYWHVPPADGSQRAFQRVLCEAVDHVKRPDPPSPSTSVAPAAAAGGITHGDLAERSVSSHTDAHDHETEGATYTSSFKQTLPASSAGHGAGSCSHSYTHSQIQRVDPPGPPSQHMDAKPTGDSCKQHKKVLTSTAAPAAAATAAAAHPSFTSNPHHPVRQRDLSAATPAGGGAASSGAFSILSNHFQAPQTAAQQPPRSFSHESMPQQSAAAHPPLTSKPPPTFDSPDAPNPLDSSLLRFLVKLGDGVAGWNSNTIMGQLAKAEILSLDELWEKQLEDLNPIVGEGVAAAITRVMDKTDEAEADEAESAQIQKQARALLFDESSVTDAALPSLTSSSPGTDLYAGDAASALASPSPSPPPSVPVVDAATAQQLLDRQRYEAELAAEQQPDSARNDADPEKQRFAEWEQARREQEQQDEANEEKQVRAAQEADEACAAAKAAEHARSVVEAAELERASAAALVEEQRRENERRAQEAAEKAKAARQRQLEQERKEKEAECQRILEEERQQRDAIARLEAQIAAAELRLRASQTELHAAVEHRNAAVAAQFESARADRFRFRGTRLTPDDLATRIDDLYLNTRGEAVEELSQLCKRIAGVQFKTAAARKQWERECTATIEPLMVPIMQAHYDAVHTQRRAAREKLEQLLMHSPLEWRWGESQLQTSDPTVPCGPAGLIASDAPPTTSLSDGVHRVVKEVRAHWRDFHVVDAPHPPLSVADLRAGSEALRSELQKSSPTPLADATHDEIDDILREFIVEWRRLCDQLVFSPGSRPPLFTHEPLLEMERATEADTITQPAIPVSPLGTSDSAAGAGSSPTPGAPSVSAVHPFIFHAPFSLLSPYFTFRSEVSLSDALTRRAELLARVDAAKSTKARSSSPRTLLDPQGTLQDEVVATIIAPAIMEQRGENKQEGVKVNFKGIIRAHAMGTRSTEAS